MSVNELRIALTTDEYEKVVSFFRDDLGLNPVETWGENGRGQLFSAEPASLEIFDPEYAASIDAIEAGGRTSGQIRFAFRVSDLEEALENVRKAGANQVHEPVITPWGDLNVRIVSPDGLQVTLWQKASISK